MISNITKIYKKPASGAYLTRYQPCEACLERVRAIPYGMKKLGECRKAMNYAVKVLCRIYTGKQIDNWPGRVAIGNDELKVICGNSTATWSKLKSALIKGGKGGLIVTNKSWDNGTLTGNPRALEYWLAGFLEDCEWEKVAEKRDSRLVKLQSDARNEGNFLDEAMALQVLKDLDLSQKRNGVKRTLAQIRRERIRMQNVIERFTNKVRIGEVTGRGSSSLTQLCFELRDCYMIDNERTGEVDVKNCQPLLMADLYPDDCAERQDWIKLATGRGIYEAIESFTGKTRQEAKDTMVQWIGGSKTCKSIDRWMRSAGFTQLLEICTNMKSGGSTKGLCHHLQRLESGVIVKAFRRRWEGHVMTIHDSVRVERSRLNEAKELLENIFLEKFSFVPTLVVTKEPKQKPINSVSDKSNPS